MTERRDSKLEGNKWKGGTAEKIKESATKRTPKYCTY